MESSSQSPQAKEIHGQMPSVDNNSDKSKVIPIILGIAAVVGIAIAAYVLGAKQSQPVVQNIAQTTTIPSPTPIDETANWKTYTNTILKFSIRYPYNATEPKERKLVKGSFVGKVLGNVSIGLPYKPSVDINLGLGKDIGKVISIIVYASNDSKYFNGLETIAKKTKVGGYQALYYYQKGYAYPIHFYFVQTPTMLYEITLEDAAPNESQDLFDQILSTFRFSP